MPNVGSAGTDTRNELERVGDKLLWAFPVDETPIFLEDSVLVGAGARSAAQAMSPDVQSIPDDGETS